MYDNYRNLLIILLSICLMTVAVGCGSSSGSNRGIDPNSDLDSDSVLNKDDNCVNISNKNQSDINNDGIGDACDPYFTAQISIILDD